MATITNPYGMPNGSYAQGAQAAKKTLAGPSQSPASPAPTPQATATANNPDGSASSIYRLPPGTPDATSVTHNPDGSTTISGGWTGRTYTLPQGQTPFATSLTPDLAPPLPPAPARSSPPNPPPPPAQTAVQRALVTLPKITGRYDNGDSDVSDAIQMLQNAGHQYLGHPLNDAQLDAFIRGQGWKPGDKYVGATGLNSLLNDIANSSEATAYADAQNAPAPPASTAPTTPSTTHVALPPSLTSLLSQQAASALPSLPFADDVVSNILSSLATRRALK